MLLLASTAPSGTAADEPDYYVSVVIIIRNDVPSFCGQPDTTHDKQAGTLS